MSDEPTTRADPDRFTALLRRLKEHRIAQWTVGYAAVAYGIQHAVTLTSEAYEWPNVVTRLSMTLLALGLPIAMTLAWYHGERASRRVSAGEMSIVTVLLVGISLIFFLFVRSAPESLPARAVAEAGVAAARSASLNPGNAISIAVMPFANLSLDKAQEFFSDGMTDEIAVALAKVPDLRVVARSSAFEFKGQNREARAIGQALGATHLIEGSVRQDGTRVRITAELIRADSGLQIWSENYDRDLTDVFAIQEDIARAITTSLRMPLGLKPGENLVNNRGIDPESYQQFLRAKALLRARSLDEAIAVLEPLVAREPNFAPAWATLAQSYILWPAYNQASIKSGSPEQERQAFLTYDDKAEKAAREAIHLDPRNAVGYGALAPLESRRAGRAKNDEFYQQALALDPGDPEILDGYSQWLAAAGRVKEALRLREQLRASEPFVPIYSIITADYFRLAGQNDTAIHMLETVIPGDPQVTFGRDRVLAEAYAAAGRYSEAADTILAIPENQNRVSRRSVEDAARLLRMAPRKVSAPDRLPAFNDELNFVYTYVGAPDRVLEAAERSAALNDDRLSNGRQRWLWAPLGNVRPLWSPQNAPVRRTERFKALMRNTGLVDYWRARGWPEFCHPTTGDDFECN